MTRILGVDYGDVRTGLAISDEGRFLAGGIGTIREGGMRATAKNRSSSFIFHPVCKRR